MTFSSNRIYRIALSLSTQCEMEEGRNRVAARAAKPTLKNTLTLPLALSVTMRLHSANWYAPRSQPADRFSYARIREGLWYDGRREGNVKLTVQQYFA